MEAYRDDSIRGSKIPKKMSGGCPKNFHSSRKPSLQACTLDVDELLSKCKPIVVVHLQEYQLEYN